MEISALLIIWLHLVGLRFLLVMLPQYGYIFPDEFFQSPEIMAGDVFGVKSARTWEWISDHPIRSILYPLLSSGIPFKAFQWLNDYFDLYPLLTPSTMLLLPRVWVTLQSLLVDFFIYKATKRGFDNQRRAYAAVIMFSSSYTTWVFCTRTFSNATETLFFAALIYAVIPQAKEEREKVPFLNNFAVALVVVCGAFVRISFLIFAFVPVAVWMMSCIKAFLLPTLISFIRKGLQMAMSALAIVFSLTLLDTAYHDPEHLVDSSGNFLEWLSELTLTPLNLLIYNTNVANLKQHGLHPLYTHALVNFPLMFGPLGTVIVHDIYRLVHDPIKDDKIDKETFLAACIIWPMLMLSFIPHQEPRFILPLIVPAVILVAGRLEKVENERIFLLLWTSFNFLLFIFYGVFHQGGVLPSINHIYREVRAAETSVNFAAHSCNMTFIYYHTYMPPPHLARVPLMVQAPGSLRKCSLNLIDVKGAPFQVLDRYIRNALQDSQVYVVFPTTIACSDHQRLQKLYLSHLRFEYFPHFTGEDLPWGDEVRCPDEDHLIRPMISSLDFLQRLTLRMYKIEHSTDKRSQQRGTIVKIAAPVSTPPVRM